MTLKEVGGLAKVLGIPAIDVGPFYAAALDKARILSDPKCYGEAVRESLPVVVSNLPVNVSSAKRLSLLTGHNPERLP